MPCDSRPFHGLSPSLLAQSSNTNRHQNSDWNNFPFPRNTKRNSLYKHVQFDWKNIWENQTNKFQEQTRQTRCDVERQLFFHFPAKCEMFDSLEWLVYEFIPYLPHIRSSERVHDAKGEPTQKNCNIASISNWNVFVCMELKGSQWEKLSCYHSNETGKYWIWSMRVCDTGVRAAVYSAELLNRIFQLSNSKEDGRMKDERWQRNISGKRVLYIGI